MVWMLRRRGVPARSVVRLEEVDVVMGVEKVCRCHAGDAASDDGDAHQIVLQSI